MALASWPSACESTVLYVDGSISARSWPCFTGEFQSTYSLAMFPEIWLLTSTVVPAWSVPVAVTVWVSSPRVTGVVVNSGGLSDASDQKYQPQAPAAATMTTNTSQPVELLDLAMGKG